jgi:hypothetical protein
MAITLNGSTGITTPTYGGAVAAEYIAPVTSFKNRIINGAMQVWQRATSGTTSGYCCADRYIFDNNGTYSRSTDVPTGFQYSLSVSVTTATQFGAFGQRIESANCADLVGNQVTLSFWIKTTSGSTAMTATLFRANAVDNFSGLTSIQAQSFTSSGSWTKVTLTYSSLPALAANGLMVYIFSNDNAVTPTYLITGVQLEKGSTATSFDYRPYGTELALCQRYFQIFKGGAGYLARFSAGQAWNPNNTANHNVSFLVSMRAAPVLTQSGLQLYAPSIGSASATISLGSDANENGVQINTTGSTGLSSGNIWWVVGTDTSSFAAFSSEL